MNTRGITTALYLGQPMRNRARTIYFTYHLHDPIYPGHSLREVDVSDKPAVTVRVRCQRPLWESCIILVDHNV